MTLALLGNTLLRAAITRNLVSFPGRIRPFMKRGTGDLQERIVQLYFVRGWSVRSICERYNLSKAMTHKLLAEWRIRAVESGYIQEIEPGILSGLLQTTAHPAEPVAEPSPAGAVGAMRAFAYAVDIQTPTPPAEIPAAFSAGRST
jgi:transposase-like protein